MSPEVWIVSDAQRDVEKYHSLLRAIQRATDEIRHIEAEGPPDIDRVLGRLLPHLVAALNGQRAFVATPIDRRDGQALSFKLTAVHPDVELCGQTVQGSSPLAQLVSDGQPRVIEPLAREPPDLIEGLEVLEASSAVLARLRTSTEVRIVGICNKAAAHRIPYLAADRMILDSIVQLVATGVRAGERRTRELQSIQKTSAAISAELELDKLLPMIATSAAQVFDAEATSLMLWDERQENLTIQASCGISGEYVHRRQITQEVVDGVMETVDLSRPILIIDLHRDPLGDVILAEKEGLRVALAALLLVRDRPIGSLNIYSKRESRSFSPDEQELAQILANQAAAAIHNAQLYEESKRQNQYYQALNEAGKAIAEGFTASRKEVLDHITEQAVERITGIEGPQAAWSAIMLYDESSNELLFESVYPREILPALEAQLGHGWSMDKGRAPGERIGITGRTVLLGKPQRVADTRRDTDYLEFDPDTRSELTVPMLDGERIIGVLSVESDQVGAFDADDERALLGLAEMAVIAIKNADRAKQLSRTDAVAVLGVWGADVAHDVNREVGAIRRTVFWLQQQDGLSPELVEGLAEIDDYANRLALPELLEQAPVSGRAIEFSDAPLLDTVIAAEIDALKSSYPLFTLQMDRNCPDIRVAIHEQWLRRLARHLVRNAMNAFLPEHSVRVVTVRTLAQDHVAEVQVEDTGKGVRPEIRSQLFHQPVDHPDGRSGRGLLLVRFLAELHGGYARLVWTHQGRGSCFAFGLPLAEPTDYTS